MAGTQIGKTTLLQAFLAAVSICAPAPAMLAAPDRDACRELRDKFYRLAEATAPVARLLPPTWRRNDQWIDFGPMICHLAWSGSKQRLSGKACRYVLCTEVDRWQQSPREGSTEQLIAERVKAFYRSLIIYEGTPTDEASSISALYEASDQRKYLVPCPHCGMHQELRMFPQRDGQFAGNGGIVGIQGDDGDWLVPDAARHAAYYRCLRGCRIDSHEKSPMVAAGVWCPKGQAVTASGNLKGKPERGPRHAGFNLNSLYSETVDFGRMAAEYLTSRENPKTLQSFWNNWLALKWTVRSKAPKWQRIGRRLAGAHRRGTVPSGAFFLTAGIDNQDNCAYWLVRAWGESCTSWLVDWGKVSMRVDENGQSVPASDLDQLDALVLEREFPLIQPNPVGAQKLRVRLANIDYQGHRTWEVFNWVRSRTAKGTDRLRIIAGDSRVPAGDFYRMSILEKTNDGKVYPGGLKRWALDVDTYKQDVQGRFEAALDQPGAWFLTADILDDGQDYLRQICNEGQRRTRNQAGREVVRWELIDHRTGNHYWDAEIYARAAADMVTGHDWTDLARRAASSVPAATTRPARGPKPETASRSQPYGRDRD